MHPSGVASYEDINPIGLAFCSLTSLNLTSSKILFLTQSHWELMLQHMGLDRGRHITHSIKDMGNSYGLSSVFAHEMERNIAV